MSNDINNNPNFDETDEQFGPNDLTPLFDETDKQRGPNDITPFTRPGVIRIECVPLNRAYFFEVADCWFGPREFLSDLKNNKCKNKELLQDFKKFGEDNFDMKVECCGRQFFDDEKRRECLKRVKNNWKGSFY